MAMAITHYTPSPPLNSYIATFWYCEGPAPTPRLKVMPMPSLHMMVNFGDPLRLYEAGQVTPFVACAESWTVGLWNTYHVMDWPERMQILNVSFKPGGAYQFLRIPLSELHNQVVSLDNIWGRLAAEIRERLYAAPTVQARFALLEKLLLARLQEAPRGLDAMQYAVAEIAHCRGAISIGGLSSRTGISNKHLDSQFKRLVGTTPKELARIYRFKYVLYSIDSAQPVDWTRLACNAGYYDQSHFNRDFEAFTGHNPTEYLRLLSLLHDGNLELARYPQHLPTG